jgi:hypothetical protein
VSRATFTSFVVLAGMRTGSNFLEASLNALTGVVSHGEVFNPYFIGKKDQVSLLGIGIADRDADPIRLLDAMRGQSTGLPGFRFFHDHDPRILDDVLADPGCAKIILTRNPLDSYVSWKIAQQTGQWKLTNLTKRRQSQVTFDPVEFETHASAAHAFQRLILQALQTTGQTAFYLDYDDLNDVGVLNGLAAFLGVPGRLDAPDQTLIKQNPGDLADKVTNPEAISVGLARLDRFNLARTPNFEPRRAPAVPSFIASPTAGILYMPVRGGPEQQVCQWLSATSAGSVQQDFTQKSLRHWFRNHAPHCSFTVVRHPLLRAYAAFRHQLLAGHAPEAQAALARMRGVDLPENVTGFDDAAAERSAFAAFLGFVKANLAGQTSSRVSPYWASQTAIIQGFAQFHGPDVILREDRMISGLAFVADQAGLLAVPPLPHDECHDARRLAAIHDDSLEAAAEAAYPRDYLAYGFGRWKAAV